MTVEQEKEVIKIGQKLQEIFPKMYGSIRFNLKPGREVVNINREIIIFEESKRFEP